MDAAYLQNLNAQQRAAVVFGRDPLLIVAGAGTGKTKTVAHRVAHLLATGVDPGRILLLTFTRRAAAEMIRRVRSLTEGSPAAKTVGRIWGGTFHSQSNRLLRLHGAAVGLDPAFTVIDRSDAEDLLNICRSELGLDKGEVRFPRKETCTSIYSRCVNAQEAVDVAVHDHFPWCQGFDEQLKGLFKAYTLKKQQQNVLDYDDLLLYWLHLMNDETAAADVRSRFDAVLVDEYQDTNALQAEILKKLRPDGRGLTVVGDDAQSIYAFRAATVHNILDFPKTFAGAEVLKLEQNYRSVQPILDATNAVIALSPQRYQKDLFAARAGGQKPMLVTALDEDQQSDWIIRRILEHHEAGVPLRHQAVLFRAAHHSDSLEVELARRNIPFVKYGGLKFLEAAHVKDALSFLRIAENPRDVTSIFRAIQLLDGIGPASARAAVAHLVEHGYELKSWAEFLPPAAARGQWGPMVKMLMKLRDGEGGPPLPDQIAAIRKFYDPILEKRFDQANVRKRDLDQLEQIAGTFTSRGQMLTELALDPPNSTQDLAGPPLVEEDYLILSTVHSAKGCEWDAVYVIHASDGNFPSDMSTGSTEGIEEERRLFYVAMTRAKDFLYVTMPLKYYQKKWAMTDRHSYAQLTRFIPPDLLPLFDRITMEAPAGTADAPSSAKGQDVKKKIAAMWD